MKVVIAIDSFKGSVSSAEAGDAAANGVKDVMPDAKVVVKTLADGGEGTMETLTQTMGGTIREIKVMGPVAEPVCAKYGTVKDTGLAVMEMSQAAGITLVPDRWKNPLNTTTYGVGEMILDALNQGCREFIIGIGGSATNDGGIGMLQALGVEFHDRVSSQVEMGASGLSELTAIDISHMDKRLSECKFRVACDVDNPLCGERGCSAVYGPQKGADEAMIRDMDRWLACYGKLTADTLGTDADINEPGVGAAGGLGYAFRNYLNAELVPGIDVVLGACHMEDDIKDADLVITGEGRIDGQTVNGKAPAGVAAMAARYNVPVIAIAGSVSPDAMACHDKGITAIFPVVRGVTTLEDAMDSEMAQSNIRDTVGEIMRVITGLKIK